MLIHTTYNTYTTYYTNNTHRKKHKYAHTHKIYTQIKTNLKVHRLYPHENVWPGGSMNSARHFNLTRA